MRAQIRETEPDVLSGGKTKWTEAWRAKCREGGQFRWPQVDKQPLSAWLLPVLSRQTMAHCSFCDSFPVQGVSRETIEHFHPKSEFPDLAFGWDNLFYCCDACQGSKLSEFDVALLKPDEPGYDFHRFFLCDYSTGKILPNPSASDADQNRACTTIRLYGLNEHGRPTSRLRELHKRAAAAGMAIDDFAFRDFLAPGG